MPSLRMLLAGLTLVAVASSTSALAGAGGSNMGVGVSDALPASSRAEIEALADEINRHRVAIGCRALVFDGRLAVVAQRQSADMVRRGYFDHTNPDGDNPFDRLQAADIRYRAAGENLAQGQTSGRQTFDDWMASPGHRRNLENCQYTHMGIGVYQHTWSLELVRYAN